MFKLLTRGARWSLKYQWIAFSKVPILENLAFVETDFENRSASRSAEEREFLVLSSSHRCALEAHKEVLVRTH